MAPSLSYLKRILNEFLFETSTQTALDAMPSADRNKKLSTGINERKDLKSCNKTADSISSSWMFLAVDDLGKRNTQRVHSWNFLCEPEKMDLTNILSSSTSLDSLASEFILISNENSLDRSTLRNNNDHIDQSISPQPISEQLNNRLPVIHCNANGKLRATDEHRKTKSHFYSYREAPPSRRFNIANMNYGIDSGKGSSSSSTGSYTPRTSPMTTSPMNSKRSSAAELVASVGDYGPNDAGRLRVQDFSSLLLRTSGQTPKHKLSVVTSKSACSRTIPGSITPTNNANLPSNPLVSFLDRSVLLMES